MADALLQVENVSKRFGGLLAVNKASFTALPGRITADGKIVMSFHAFVLKTGRHTILIDGCIGNDKERPTRPQFHRPDYLFLSLPNIPFLCPIVPFATP